MFQRVQFQTVAEVEPLPALLTCVRFAGAVNGTFVVVQGARRGEGFVAFVAGNAWPRSAIVARDMALKGPARQTLLSALRACQT